MKYFLATRYQFIVWVFLPLVFIGCIGKDYIDDFVEPAVRIDNPIIGLQTSDTHTYSATFFNTIGQPENTGVSWSSSNESIITINEQGLATALTEGQATISVSVVFDGETISDQDEIVVSTEEMENNQESNRSGTIRSTSSYDLEGEFALETSGKSLLLSFNSNYVASSSLPGLYLYLSNNPNSINGALEVGAVTVFDGAHSYAIPDTGINDYQYLLYWCKPFSVKVGDGLIN
ncbi:MULTISPECIES: Ig-like domain-containing protein [Flavobacteriaceae]|uniref:Ig-like domain-containing protein n=1 Tax=Flavobacteriaceae TaxID=49546 RepID=UPI001491462C|nr:MULTISPECIES: Ig-like domain-containing protein [Allomuricauda]MDC6366376.1 Ig-like domain-containing protein [Muricauda sp. AC10]